MTEVISVRFKNKGKVYYFDPCGAAVPAGSNVIVETAKGMEFAECVSGNHQVEDEAVHPPLRPLIRVATPEDEQRARENRRREQEAFEVCRQKIARHGLDMKLVDVEYNFEGSKILFFFTSDGRVDFRELVKDLAGVFKTRIELRQIGVRDEARMLGGLGICGRPFCCAQFLEDFQPVSIKMAKTQGLSLNPTKISGTCGRLMCCLKYEQDAYEELVQRVPKVDAFVETPDGVGSVVDVNVLKGTVRVHLEDQSDPPVRTYEGTELTVLGGKAKRAEYLAQRAEGLPEAQPRPVQPRFRRPEPQPVEEGPAPEATAEEAQPAEQPARQERRDRRRGNDGKRRDNRRRDNQPRESKENREGRENRESRENRENRENREPRDRSAQREPRENREPRESRQRQEGEARDDRGQQNRRKRYRPRGDRHRDGGQPPMSE